MKTIFLGDAAKDSGSFGFSEACPLFTEKKVSHQLRPMRALAKTYQPAHTAWTLILSAMSTINSTLA